MSAEAINREKEKYFGALNYLSLILDFLVAPDCKQKMIFSPQYYTKSTADYAAYVGSFPFNTIFSPFQLDTLVTMLYSIYYYEDEKRLFQSQRWIEFVDYANTLNVLFKEAVQRYKVTTENPIPEGSIISGEDIHKALQTAVIYNVCTMFDSLASPRIEEEITDNIGCFVTVSVGHAIDFLISSCPNERYSIVGKSELKDVRQLRDAVRRQYLGSSEDGYEKGFSKTKRWIEFIDDVNRVNIFLQERIRRYNPTFMQEFYISSDYIDHDVQLNIIRTMIFSKQLYRETIKKFEQKINNAESSHSACCASEIDREMQSMMISSLCQILEFLASDNIEEETVCAFDCCVLKDARSYIEILTESCIAENQSVLGETELKALRQLYEKLSSLGDCYCKNGAKGFSKTKSWTEFVMFINTIQTLLKNELNKS